MKESLLRIPFPLVPGADYDFEERFKFWDSPSTIQWFNDHGYTYTPRPSDTEPQDAVRQPYGELYEVEYPYAYYDSSGTPPLGALNMSGKVVFAEDSRGRHVAIKLVRDGTDEYRILRFLSHQNLETLKENCIIPVLDLLPAEGFWFAVMPRWGPHVHLPWLDNARHVLEIIHSMLKAVAFLHAHNIAHGDLNQENVLVNHFSDYDYMLENNHFRTNLRYQNKLRYALFDFDFSIMLDSEADKSLCRLPYQKSWGTFNFTKDTAQGEFDFNPFVLDVGALGVRLCWFYQHLTPQLPILAPLFDRMTTRDLNRRPTASETLRFFEDLCLELSEAELNSWVQVRDRAGVEIEEYDRWKCIPADFAKKWGKYKEPPVPLTTKILRAICRRPWMSHLVPLIRWSFFKLFFLTRRFATLFTGLKPFSR